MDKEEIGNLEDILGCDICVLMERVSSYRHLHSSLIDSPSKTSDDLRNNQLPIALHPSTPPCNTRENRTRDNISRPSSILDGKWNEEQASQRQTRKLR
jgi:hypothetical protein